MTKPSNIMEKYGFVKNNLQDWWARHPLTQHVMFNIPANEFPKNQSEVFDVRRRRYGQGAGGKDTQFWHIVSEGDELYVIKIEIGNSPDVVGDYVYVVKCIHKDNDSLVFKMIEERKII